MHQQDENAEISKHAIINFSFQWVVGDSRPLEKSLLNLVKSKFSYIATFASRFIAFALTFVVAKMVLPETRLSDVFLIVLAASYAVWLPWGLTVFSLRAVERLKAQNANRVGWNEVTIDRRGIIWSTDTAYEYTSWLGVSDVVELEGALWIKTNPLNGYYLPSRLFSSKEGVQQCLIQIALLRNNATPPAHYSAAEDGQVVRH